MADVAARLLLIIIYNFVCNFPLERLLSMNVGIQQISDFHTQMGKEITDL